MQNAKNWSGLMETKQFHPVQVLVVCQTYKVRNASDTYFPHFIDGVNNPDAI